MNYEMAIKWITEQADEISLQKIEEIHSLIPILIQTSQIISFLRQGKFFRSADSEGDDPSTWFYRLILAPGDLEYIQTYWGTQEPTSKKARILKEAFKNLLLQQLLRFKPQERSRLLDVLAPLLNQTEVIAHESLWLALFAQTKQTSPPQLVKFLLVCPSEQTLQILFLDYFVSLQTSEERSPFHHCQNFYRLAPYYLKQIQTNPDLISIQNYLKCFANRQEILFDFLAEWIQQHPATTPMNREAWAIAKLFVAKASDMQLEQLIPFWEKWLEHPELRGYHLSLVALFRIYKPSGQGLLSASLLQQETDPVRQDMLLRQAQRGAFVYRTIWWDAWQSGQAHLQNRAVEILAHMRYDRYHLFNYRWAQKSWPAPLPPNDPAFWLRLWKETDCPAVQLNGACELFRAEPDNTLVRDWLVQQMETVSAKRVAKIWTCLREAAPPDFCLALALLHLDSPRPLLREQAAKQLAALPASETTHQALLGALRDRAVPVQIQAAKALAVQAPESVAFNHWLKAQLNGGEDFVAAEALKLIARLKRSEMLPLLQSMRFAHSSRLLARLQKTLTKLGA
ncbi:MAG: HEAT repeat domain-containing protein [Candidatus Sericytochromatia bacterium]